MRKNQRHALIKQIINNHQVGRQEDIVEILQKQGIQVTQATISRDIKELQLVKVATVDGRLRYALPKTDSHKLNSVSLIY